VGKLAKSLSNFTSNTLRYTKAGSNVIKLFRSVIYKFSEKAKKVFISIRPTEESSVSGLG
jgi:hypothetical protein